MPKVTRICKACGKEYEACRTPNWGVFRWRDVACSIECAEKYFHDVMVARGEIEDEKPEEVSLTKSTSEVLSKEITTEDSAEDEIPVAKSRKSKRAK